jgi:hypothetical protein
MKIVQRVLLVIIGAIFLMSAYGKFMSTPEALAMLESFGFQDYRIALAAICVIIPLSLILRRTRCVGVMIASAYLGGAIALTLGTGELPLLPGITLLLVWIVGKIQLWRSHGACECGNCTCEPKPVEQQ